MLAGHETSANTLSWSLPRLSAYPSGREELEGELDAVLGDRAPEAGDADKLPWTRARPGPRDAAPAPQMTRGPAGSAGGGLGGSGRAQLQLVQQVERGAGHRVHRAVKCLGIL